MAAQGALLKDALKGWKSGLSDGWRDFFAGVEPDLDALGALTAADCHPLPQGAGGAAQRHLTRAFDGLAPDKVRVVVIGEDPYPEKKKKKEATGRAFEDGAWKWDPKKKLTGIAPSLKPLLLSAAACEIDGFKPTGAAGEVETLAAHIAEDRLMSPAAPDYFDALNAQGVLFVNAAWTFTKAQAVSESERKTENEKNQSMHRQAWRSVMEHLLRDLTWRDGGRPIVFLLLGEKAQTRFRQSVGKHFKTDSIDNSVRMATVHCAHPAPQSVRLYFKSKNPLARVNEALEALGSPKIRWWPSAKPAAPDGTP